MTGRPTKPEMLANPIGRSTPEWWGRNNDAMPPPRVCLRVLARQGNKCALTGVTIRDGDLTTPDHIKPLILGGENREKNIQIVLRAAHTAKTGEDVARKGRADRAKKKGLGMVREAAPIQSAPMPTTPRAASRRERAETTDKTRLGIGGRWIFGKFYEDERV